MRALLAIAFRELRERWTLLLAAFGWGFVPIAVAWRAGESALPIAVVAAVVAAWGVALLMGGSVIARDLGDGRLGFFYARPIPWWSIGGGKLLAALLLAPVTAVAGALPALVAERGLASLPASFLEALSGGGLALQLALLVALVAFGHAAGVVYRSRSAWAALDVLLFAAAAGSAVAAFRAFVRLGVLTSADMPHPWLVALLLFIVSLVPLAAAAAQMALGRSDARRAHGALSLTFWGGAIVLAAAVAGLLVRELWATPQAFAARALTRAAGDGRFVALLASGPAQARSRAASFLLDTTSGRSLRIPALALAAFAPSGSHAVWVEDAPFWRPHELDLQLARLHGPQPESETIALDPPLPNEPVRELALAGAGERVAIVQPSTLSVHALPSGRSLSRSTVADGEWVTAAFLPDGHVRALRRVRAVVGGPGHGALPGFVEVVELAGGVASSRVPLEAVGHAMPASSIAGARILLHEPLVPRTISLHDAASGRRLRAFAGEDGFPIHDAGLLADGSVAVIENSGAACRLRLASDGAGDRLVALPKGLALLGGELPRGRITVGLITGFGVGGPVATVIVERETGVVVRKVDGLLPALLGGLNAGRSGGSSGAGTLFQTSAGALVRLDPETGEQLVLLEAVSR